jgi:hypothetical protein
MKNGYRKRGDAVRNTILFDGLEFIQGCSCDTPDLSADLTIDFGYSENAATKTYAARCSECDEPFHPQQPNGPTRATKQIRVT